MRGRPFAVGNQMGRGRPLGSRNKKSVLSEMLESYGEPIIKQCVVDALKGKPTAQRLCMERLLPPCKPSNHRFRLPPVKTAADLGLAWQSVTQQVGLGRISPQDGEAMASMLEMRRKSIESEQLDSRPVDDGTGVDHSLLTDEEFAQAKQLSLAATKKKDQ